MRRLVSVLSLSAAIALLAPACSSSSSSAPDDTCGFIADPGNCYRKLVAAVDDCLKDATTDGGVGMTSGTLAADGKSCTYASGRTVTFGSDARQYSASKTALDVTVTLAGRTCVHYASEPRSAITVVGPDGATVSVGVAGFGETITCPDGSQHGIDAQKLFNGGCGDGGSAFDGLPGTITSSGGNSASGSLVGMKNLAYSCTAP